MEQPIVMHISNTLMINTLTNMIADILDKYRKFDISYVTTCNYSDNSLDSVSMTQMTSTHMKETAEKISKYAHSEFVHAPLSESGYINIGLMNLQNEYIGVIQCICVDNKIGTINLKVNRYNVDAIRVEMSYLDEFIDISLRIIHNSIVITSVILSEKRRKFRKI